jgi:uncharacterized membrane protein
MPPNSDYYSLKIRAAGIKHCPPVLFFFGDHIDIFYRAFFSANSAALAVIEIDVEFLLIFLKNNALRAYSFAHGAARAFIVFVNRPYIAPVACFIIS